MQNLAILTGILRGIMSSLDILRLFEGLPVAKATLNHKELRATDKRMVGHSLYRDSLIVIVSNNDVNVYIDYTFNGKVVLDKVVINMLASKKPNATLADIDLRDVFRRIADNEAHLQAVFLTLVATDTSLSKIKMDFTPYKHSVKNKRPLRLLE